MKNRHDNTVRLPTTKKGSKDQRKKDVMQTQNYSKYGEVLSMNYLEVG
jgi:hypothetical protein